MKELIIKISIFISAIWIFFAIFFYKNKMALTEGIIGFTRGQIAYLNKEIEKHENVSIRTIILGDSTSFPLIFNYFSLRGLGLPVGTFIESYYMLKKYLQNRKTPPMRIILISKNHLDRYPDTFWYSNVLLKFYDFQDLKEIESAFFQSGELKLLTKSSFNFTARINFWSKYFCIKTYCPIMFINEFQRYFYFKQREQLNWYTLDQIKRNRGFIPFDKKNEKFIDLGIDNYSKSDPILHEVFKFYLDKILEIAKIYNIKIYYVFLPTRSEVGSGELKLVNYRNQLLNYLSGKEKVSLIDIPLTLLKKEEYFDDYHLNDKGGKIVADEIIRQVIGTEGYL